ncbi:MAG: guanylate kinase [Planctomycetes bacterium]|nr:guanylate kinase [Planctomycetota bacterium]
MNDNSGRGVLVILSGPSGAGKSSVCTRLRREFDAEMSVSATTRPPRPGEVNGKDYWFLDREDFLSKAQTGYFAEHAEYCGHYYGTPLRPLQDALREGRVVLLEIEVEGARQIRERFPEAVSIFIAPPSAEEAVRRLEKRRQNTAQDIAKRTKQATIELERAKEYDYVVVNDNLGAAVAEVKDILTRERAKRLGAFSQ